MGLRWVMGNICLGRRNDEGPPHARKDPHTGPMGAALPCPHSTRHSLGILTLTSERRMRLTTEAMIQEAIGSNSRDTGP